MPSNDADLLFAYARRGEVASLSALVARHTVWLMAFLRGMLPSADVEDVFQEVWARVIKTAHTYRGGAVKSYLARIARSAAIDRLRRDGRSESLDIEDEHGESLSADLPSTAPTPRESFESKATAEDVRAAIAALPIGERQVLLLRIEGELSFREIAEELGIPLGTALTRMRNATERLKRQLGERT